MDLGARNPELLPSESEGMVRRPRLPLCRLPKPPEDTLACDRVSSSMWGVYWCWRRASVRAVCTPTRPHTHTHTHTHTVYRIVSEFGKWRDRWVLR